MANIYLHFLGPPRIERNGTPVSIDTRKAVALLAYLAIARSDGMYARDSLAALLYPDYSQERARASFRRTLSALRSGIGGDLLRADRELVSLTVGRDVWCDVLRFRTLIDQCTHHDHAPGSVCVDCLPLLQDAAALYTDDFLAGFSLRDSVSFDDWQFFETENLRREYGTVLERLVRGLGAQERWQQAIEVCHRWLNLDPLHEPAHRRLIQLFAWSGQRSAVLRQYRECVRILDEELGVPPLPETTALYQSVVEGTDGVQATSTDSWQLLNPSAVLSSRDAPSVANRPDQAAVPRLSAGKLALVGRDETLAAMHDVYGRSKSGQFLLIEGEAGVGKTRLTEEFLQQVSATGALVLHARCYEDGGGVAYGPLVEALRASLADEGSAGRLASLRDIWLGEVRRLLPEVAALQPKLAPAVNLAGPGSQARFYEGMALAFLALLAGNPPGVLALDELQWADSATLDLLTFLARRLQGTPVMILAIQRNEHGTATDRVRRLATAGERSGHGTSMVLNRLNFGDVTSLVARAGLSDLPPDAASRLYAETEGLPLFVVEYLNAIGAGNLPIGGETWDVPRGVRQLLQTRLSAVDDVGRQLLTAGAVIGRSFPFDLLRSVSGRADEETVSGLEAMAAAGLIRELREQDRESREPRYDFAHEQLRRVIYDGASLARRRLLHRRVAEALIRSATGKRAGPEAGQIAYHYRQAGDDAEAAAYYKAAGIHARSVLANGEALGFFEAALALGHPDAAELHEAIGDLLTLQGAYARAVLAYQTAAAVNGRGRLAHLEHKLGTVYMRQGQWDLADNSFASAASAGGDPGQLAMVWADWSLCAHRQNNNARADHLARQALELTQAANDDRSRARTYNVLGMLARSQGDLQATCNYLQASLAAAERLEDLSAQIAALNNLALAAHDRQDAEQARQYLEAALALCTRVGDQHRQAALHNNLADLLHRMGLHETAMAHLKQAVQMFANIGEQPAQAADWQPEIWKLVEW